MFSSSKNLILFLKLLHESTRLEIISFSSKSFFSKTNLESGIFFSKWDIIKLILLLFSFIIVTLLSSNKPFITSKDSKKESNCLNHLSFFWTSDRIKADL